MGRPPDHGGPFDPARQASNLVITSNAIRKTHRFVLLCENDATLDVNHGSIYTNRSSRFKIFELPDRKGTHATADSAGCSTIAHARKIFDTRHGTSTDAASNKSIGRPPDGGATGIPMLTKITCDQFQGLRGSDQHRDHRYRHIKDMFQNFLFMDNFIEQGFPSDKLLCRHFVSGITPLKALEKSLGREYYIRENTVFERPKHFVRAVFEKFKGGRRQPYYEYVSPTPLPAYHCFWDRAAKKWRVSTLGLFYAVVQSDNHLDVKFTKRWFRRLGVGYSPNAPTYDELVPKMDDEDSCKWKRRKNKKKN